MSRRGAAVGATCALLLGLALSLPEHSYAGETCRTVRGRMSFYNGAPAVRIWITGTKRLLGVHDGSYANLDYLPSNVRKLWEGSGDVWSHSIHGDFRVCASTRERPGWMQIVRVEKGSNLRLKAN